jgi:hypothetical protein
MAISFSMSDRAAELSLAKESLVDIAYRIRENSHPECSGLEAVICGIELSAP